jgi:hypothetical protein
MQRQNNTVKAIHIPPLKKSTKNVNGATNGRSVNVSEKQSNNGS